MSGRVNIQNEDAKISSRGFTLIELILVMAVLTIAVAITAPALANFFRGRSLDSEARRLLSLTRQGQSRAVSEGLPMELWFDTTQNTFGLEAEPSYEEVDTRAVIYQLQDMQVEVVNAPVAGGMNISVTTDEGDTPASSTSTKAQSKHRNQPRIRFLPDGTISEQSPPLLRLTSRDGSRIGVGLSRNHLSYEIRTGAI
jgi:type II secretion system protein H